MDTSNIIDIVSGLSAAYSNVDQGEILIAVINAESRIQAAKVIANKINEHYTAMVDIGGVLNKMRARM